LRQIFGPKTKDVKGKEIKREKLMGHVAHMGEIRNAQKCLIRKFEGNRLLLGRMILKWMLKKQSVRIWSCSG
jgi:hypothetical protein